MNYEEEKMMERAISALEKIAEGILLIGKSLEAKNRVEALDALTRESERIGGYDSP